jgi:hypothetical protein
MLRASLSLGSGRPTRSTRSADQIDRDLRSVVPAVDEVFFDATGRTE